MRGLNAQFRSKRSVRQRLTGTATVDFAAEGLSNLDPTGDRELSYRAPYKNYTARIYKRLDLYSFRNSSGLSSLSCTFSLLYIRAPRGIPAAHRRQASVQIYG